MKRIEVLDFWRFLAVLFMALFHFFYDQMIFGALPRGAVFTAPYQVLRYCAVVSFVLISGMVARYSRSNIKRGFIVFCVGVAVGIVTSFFDQPILFGILHFFGCAMIIYGLVREKINKIKSPVFPVITMALFALTFNIPKTVLVPVRFLFPLGFMYPGFYSSDYYPLMPWIFLFFTGVWLGGVIERHREKKIFNIHLPGALTFIGRHSLEFYVLHQPVLYGL